MSRIPSIDFERERGEPQMLLLDSNYFNPILHGSENFTDTKLLTECKCGSTDENDYYERNKARCKYCVSKRIGIKARKRKYAVCDCGNKGKDKFYFSGEKIQYPCKECRKKCYSLKNKKRYVK